MDINSNLNNVIGFSDALIFSQKQGVESIPSSSQTLGSLDSNIHKVNILFENSKHLASEKLTKSQERALRNENKKKLKDERCQKALNNKLVNSVVLPETRLIKKTDILSLRYTQDSINHKTMDGTKINDLIDSMKTGGWKTGSQAQVVLMPDGQLTCLDNRRLFAAQKVVSLSEDPIILTDGKNQGKEFEMKIDVYRFDDNAPKKKLSGCIAEYKKGRGLTNIDQLPKEFLKSTYGHLALLRINTRNGDLPHSHFGYENPPIVREDPN